MANSSKYFLMVNDKVIKFDKESGLNKLFKGIDNILDLATFTSLFKSKEELLKCLKALGLIDSFNKDDTVITVKSKSDNEFKYAMVHTDTVYSNAAKLLSVGNLKEFFYRNRENTRLLETVMDSFYENAIGLSSIFTNKIQSLTDLGINQKDNDNILKEIEYLKSRLVRITKTIVNIERIQELLSRPEFTREELLEFIRRLDYFVEYEVYYTDKVVNDKGLVSLAGFIGTILPEYPNAIIPKTSISQREKVVARYLDAIDIKTTIRTEPIGLKRESRFSEVDKDHFGFLEPDDFENLLSEDSSEKLRESVQVDIETLEDLKKSL